MNQEMDFHEIDLREYFEILRRRAWVLVLITVVAVLVSGILSFFVLSPVYEASTILIVMKNRESGVMEYNELLLAQRLAKTYSEIAKSHRVARLVAEKVKEVEVTELMEGAISVRPIPDTELLEIVAQHSDPETAVELADTVATVFSEEIQKIMQVQNVDVIDQAQLPEEPVKPRKMLNMAVAGVLGIMLGVFAIFLLEFLDTRITSEEDITRHLQLPVLGVIPKIEPDSKHHRPA